VRAANLHEFGKALVVEDAPRPSPGPGEMLIEIEACGVCHSDLHLASGDWPGFAKLIHWPLVLGHEVVGRVAEVGTGVDAGLHGTRVGVGWVYWSCGACANCLGGRENICQNRAITSVTVNGGFAEFIVAKASHSIPVPPELSPNEAAPLFCAGVTVYRALRNAEVKPGQRVAVFGIGGLGHLAVQVAHVMGAEVVAVDVDDAKLELARQSGAKHVLNSAKQDVAQELQSMGGMHLALVATSAGAAYQAAFAGLRAGGAVAIVGLPNEPIALDAAKLARNEARILSTVVGTRQDLRNTLALAAQGKIHCHTESRPLEQVNEVFDAMRRGTLLGRVVLVP
jgi:propanol-preferring alcohol dehydrogenase